MPTQIWTVSTPDAVITIEYDPERPIGDPKIENEGNATVLYVGRLEIGVDPDASPEDHRRALNGGDQ